MNDFEKESLRATDPGLRFGVIHGRNFFPLVTASSRPKADDAAVSFFLRLLRLRLAMTRQSKGEVP